MNGVFVNIFVQKGDHFDIFIGTFVQVNEVSNIYMLLL